MMPVRMRVCDMCVDRKAKLELNFKDPRAVRVTLKNSAFLYAMRPLNHARGEDLKFYSAYEFWRYWRIENPAYPLNAHEAETECKMTDNRGHANGQKCHAWLTKEGYAKMMKRVHDDVTPLDAGVDYRVHDEGGDDWVPFPDAPGMENIRHRWILVRNARPRNPSFHGTPMPRKGETSEERNASLLMSYFRPFTLYEKEACSHCPYIAALREQNKSWHQSMWAWINGNVACEESKVFIQNFLCVTQMRPDYETYRENCSDDVFSDEALEAETHEIEDILSTRVGACKEDCVDVAGDVKHAEGNSSSDAIVRASDIWKWDGNPGAKSEASIVVSNDKITSLRKATQRSQKHSTHGEAKSETMVAHMKVGGQVKSQDVIDWIEQLC